MPDTLVYRPGGFRLDTTARIEGFTASLDTAARVFRLHWSVTHQSGFVYADLATVGAYHVEPFDYSFGFAPTSHVPLNPAEWQAPSEPQTIDASLIHPDSTEGSVRVTWTITLRVYSLTVPRDSASVVFVTWKR